MICISCKVILATSSQIIFNKGVMTIHKTKYALK